MISVVKRIQIGIFNHYGSEVQMVGWPQMKFYSVCLLIIFIFTAACDSPRVEIPKTQFSESTESLPQTTTITPDEIEEFFSSPSISPNKEFVVETVTAIPSTTLVPTQPITLTPTISYTIATSITSIITETRSYTDIVITQGGKIHQVDWSRKGKTFAVATSVGLFIYDSHFLDLTKTFDLGESVQSTLLNSDNDTVALGGLNGDIKWFDTETGQYIASFEGHSLGITDLVYLGPGNPLFSSSDDGTVRFWDAVYVDVPDYADHPNSNIIRSSNRITCLDEDQSGTYLAAGSYQSWYVWDLIAGEVVIELNGFNAWINDIVFSPEGEYLAVADTSNVLRLWKTNGWVPTHEVELEQIDSITALDFAPNQLILVIGAKNGLVLEWDLRSNELFKIADLNHRSVSDIQFDPSGSLVLISSKKGVLRLLLAQP
jgi:WD40 repeat protein